MLAPGVHRVGDYRSAQRALTDERLVHWMRRDSAPNPIAAGIARWLDAMDPAHRHPLRKTIAAALTPAAIGRLEPDLNAMAGRLTTRLFDAGEADLLQVYARPVTKFMVLRILGIEAAAFAEFDDLLDRLEPNLRQALSPAGSAGVDQAFFASWTQATAAHAQGGGLLAALSADLRAAGAEADLPIFAAMFAFAATSNIAPFIAQAAHGLAARPDVWRRLQAEPSRLPAALEEWLRYRPPLPFVHLVAAAPVNDGRISPGDSVLVALDAANRDPGMFDDPDTYRPDRNPAHLSFGHGPLACIGMIMARTLASLAIGHLLNARRPSAEGHLPYPIVNLEPNIGEAER